MIENNKTICFRTKSELDFERQPVHYVVVTAKDRGRDPRLSTATVTVLVQDTADEVPIFNTRTYQGRMILSCLKKLCVRAI